MSKWTIIYSDGTTFSSEQGSPEEAPPFGVICIPQPDPDNGRNIMHGWDWYYYNDVEGNGPMWWGCDLQGLLDRLLHRLPVKAVLQGRTVSNDVWVDLMKRADTYYREYL